MTAQDKFRKAPPAPARRPGQAGAFSGQPARAPRLRARGEDTPRKAPGHGRRNRGFVPDAEALDSWERDPARLPHEGFSVHLAPRGFLGTLLEELGDRTVTVFGRLVLAEGTEPAAWAQTSWLNPRWMPVKSIKDAAAQLSAIQRNWRAHRPELIQGCSRRMALVEEALPHLSQRPLKFGDPAPTAPLGAFTLWTPSLMLAASKTTSPFPDGEV
ncbi:MAG: hypothetical protein II595_00750, partial [Desulfovibrio sp.]|nr:hypothetical protein [Desulfovibrio sp.]